MQLRISEKNSKIGKIPNLSLTPGKSCVPGIPCFTEGCYAQSSYKRYPNVRTAWDGNFNMYNKNPDKFWNEFDAYLLKKKPQRFRLFVGGDFPDEIFYIGISKVIRRHPSTNFLVFTKRYEYDFTGKPDNLRVVLSTWPGVELPTNTDLPWSWLMEDERRPESDYFVCPGGCDDCGHTCWGLVEGSIPIVFKKH